jgi:hypothetical protein
MKKIIGGLIGTIVTVFVTLYVQGWYSRNQQQTEFQLSHNSFDSAVQLTEDERRRVFSAGNGSINVSLFEIVNSGSQPLTDQRVTIRTEPYLANSRVLAAGSTVYPGNAREGVATAIQGNTVHIDYKVLNPGEQHRLWIIDNGLGLSNLTARRPGLRVNNIERTFNEPGLFEDTVSLIFISVIFGLLTFGTGAVLGYAALEESIRKRGFSPEEILKMPEEKPTLPPKA